MHEIFMWRNWPPGIQKSFVRDPLGPNEYWEYASAPMVIVEAIAKENGHQKVLWSMQ